MDTHYSDEFIEEQKANLINQKTDLEGELAKISRWDESSGTYIALRPEYDADSTDEADQDSEETEVGETNTAITSNLEMTLADVNLALGKIEEGKYGLCEETGEWISEERLKAYPAARTCNEKGLA